MVSCQNFILQYGLSMYIISNVLGSDFPYQRLDGLVSLQLIVTCLVRATLITIVKTNEHQYCSKPDF